MGQCKLICFPYAGGSSISFASWAKDLSHGIEVVPVELPGRGSFKHKPFYRDITEAATDLICQYKSLLYGNDPFCFFGHSLGGLIAYEIIEQLYVAHKQLPFHLFFSAIFPPHINKIQRKLHELSDKKFARHLERWGALPSKIFENPEMNQQWLSILKADYQLLENYHFNPKLFDMPIDISIFKGEKDHWLTEDEYREWSRYSNRCINFYEVKGGHLFFHDESSFLLSTINQTISGYF